MLFSLNERGIRDPDLHLDILEEYGHEIDGVLDFNFEQAYLLAKKERIPLKQDISDGKWTLSENDLIQIAQYNPDVNWSKFLQLKEKDFSWFIDHNQELKWIKAEIDLNDALFYHMDSLTPILQINERILARGKKSSQFEDFEKNLLFKLYGSEKEYVRAYQISHLEPYILEYVQYLDDNTMIINIAQRIGIILDPYESNYSVPEQMYFQFDRLINIIKEEGDIFLFSEWSVSLEEIINMTYDDFIEQFGFENEEFYDSRLIWVTSN